MIIQKYNLNDIPEGVKPIVRVSQYDDLSREIVFVCPNATGIVIDGIDQDVSVSGDEISFVIGLELTEFAGIRQGEVRIGDTGSLNFNLEIENTPILLDSRAIQYAMKNRPSLPEIIVREPIKEPILKPIDLKDIADDLMTEELESKEYTDYINELGYVPREESDVETSEIGIDELLPMEEESEVDNAETDE